MMMLAIVIFSILSVISTTVNNIGLLYFIGIQTIYKIFVMSVLVYRSSMQCVYQKYTIKLHQICGQSLSGSPGELSEERVT